MNREQIMKRLQDEQMELVGLTHQYDGTKKLFDAAAMQNDGQKCDEIRFQLHTLLDMQLDLVASSMLLTRAFIEGHD